MIMHLIVHTMMMPYHSVNNYNVALIAVLWTIIMQCIAMPYVNIVMPYRSVDNDNVAIYVL